MISAAMALTGVLLISANCIPIAAMGTGLIAGVACREGAFYGMKEAIKKSPATDQSKQDSAQ